MIIQTSPITFINDNGRGTTWTLEHNGWDWILYSNNASSRAWKSTAMGKAITLRELEQRKAWRGVSSLIDEPAVIAAAVIAREARLAKYREQQA